jgi:hypothetical protein
MNVDEKTRAEWLEFYRSSAKQTIGLRRVYPSDGRVGGSAFGGLPHLPEDVPWPVNRNAQPLPFMAELELATLPRIPDLALLPPAGSLYLFLEHDFDDGVSEAKMVWLPVDLAKVPERQPPPGWFHCIELRDICDIAPSDAGSCAPAIALRPREPIDPFVMATYAGWPPGLARNDNDYFEKTFAFWELTKGASDNRWDITKDEWAAAQVPLRTGARLSDADRAAWPFDWLCVEDITWQIRFADKGKESWQREELRAPEFKAACDSWKNLALAKGFATTVDEADRKRFWDWLREVERRFDRDLAVVDKSIELFHGRHVAALSAEGQEVFRAEHQVEWRLLGHGTRLPNFNTADYLSEGKILLFACNPRSEGDFPPPFEVWIDRSDLSARHFDRLVVDAHFT